MIAVFKFKLPEEQEEYRMTGAGIDAHLVIQELDEFLRGKIKYTDEETIGLQEMRDLLHSYCNERNVVVS